jgi:competence protein ComEC
LKSFLKGFDGMRKFRSGIAVLLAVLCLVLGVCGGFIAYLSINKFSSDIYVSGDLQIHFLELGNKYTGDCTYIKAGDNDILIDAGSKSDSIPTITGYIDNYVTDGILEYVIITHAHEDHYAGFAVNENTEGLFDIYECKTIIDFALTNQKMPEEGKITLYGNYLREREAEINAGATHYTARECIEQNKSVFELSDGITMQVLDQRYYYEEAKTENDYSVCTLFTYGEQSFLFTGDLEEKGELSLIEKNDLPTVSVYKAGHHGSKTSSSDELMEVIKPEVVCVCCCAGSSEYKAAPENVFPSQKFIDSISPYTDKVYVTTLCDNYESGEFKSMNGNITVSCSLNGIQISCSANDKKLKETDWFKNNRVMPTYWQ